MSMLVALAMSSLMVNSSVSKAVVLPARALENNICWPKTPNMCNRDSLYTSRGYDTYISNNNKSKERRGSLKIKIVKRL